MTARPSFPISPPVPQAPFARFAPPVGSRSALRDAITAAYRRPERDCVRELLAAADTGPQTRAAAAMTARGLIEALRRKGTGSGVQGLVQEYALSSREGVALMCLAEALLRIPDEATRDALIRDKLAEGNWEAHLGHGRSLFVNAATWGLVVTGKLTAVGDAGGLGAALTRLIARLGEPIIRRGVDMAMRLMGEQFVIGETIEKALARARDMEARGFRYSYDMLGEAAMTAEDAARYLGDYENAVHAIGRAAAGRGVYEGPGISIKLSALHPRYARSQADRVTSELLPRVKALAVLAQGYDIGLNIDAEEADRLELSLDLLEALARDPDLAGWNGLGFVVQAYGRRCPAVIDFVVDLARRSGRRIMVRLVKGAYWDTEIKRAQVEGLADYPVFTRKIHTDVSYLACARKLLDARDAVFPQFATHNAQTLAAVHHMAGPDFRVGDYEFQCLHGMGEPLYEEVVGPDRMNRPCRVYAPVGTHETLLAYLVRRLLENGANSSFVNRIGDPAVSVDELTADPVETVRAMADIGAPHPAIAPPSALFGTVRRNSAGLDLSDERRLETLSRELAASASTAWTASPTFPAPGSVPKERPVLDPADHDDAVGTVSEAAAEDVAHALSIAARGAAAWAAVSPEERAARLEHAADLMEARMETLMGLVIREAGKTAANAVGEVREAVDFLRYYAAETRAAGEGLGEPLGPVVCISPWNFPLAIFTGQIAAALAAGNPVLAKPAEETPLVAAESVRILHAAGIPPEALQLVPGDGETGAALVASPLSAGVMFTGSTEVARLIQQRLAERVDGAGKPVPLIAETGGQNAMIVDSSALAEQVVADVIASAFDSAGQRCSALRILCVQEEVADRILDMLKGALRELRIGRPDELAVDIGPVIDEAARETIEAHVARMAQAGRRIERLPLPAETTKGTFVAPTIIEIDSVSELGREVFGPVLHVMRFRREDLGRVLDAIDATGYGLTFGLHTRLDETFAEVTGRVRVGNVYVNRNVIGAVVGVQPFGGRGLSGTGPKAGGPLYLGRLVRRAPSRFSRDLKASTAGALAELFADHLARTGRAADAAAVRLSAASSPLGIAEELPGPVGERNLYEIRPRGRVLLMPMTETGLVRQIGAALAGGNAMMIDESCGLRESLAGLPETVAERIRWTSRPETDGPYAAALVEGDRERVIEIGRRLAAMPGPLVLLQAASTQELQADPRAYATEWLVEEVSTSINTTAAGGNAALMANI